MILHFLATQHFFSIIVWLWNNSYLAGQFIPRDISYSEQFISGRVHTWYSSGCWIWILSGMNCLRVWTNSGHVCMYFCFCRKQSLEGLPQRCWISQFGSVLQSIGICPMWGRGLRLQWVGQVKEVWQETQSLLRLFQSKFW